MASRVCCITHLSINRRLIQLEEVDTRGGWTKSKRDRANAFQSLGLDHYIDRSSRQQHEKPSSTVLANALCAIIGAVWLDLLRQNESAFNITEQISRILHRIGTVITGTTAGGAPMTDESNPGVLEDNDGVQGGTHSEERGFTTSNESFDPDIDLPDIFTHQGSIQDQNDALQSIHPTNTRFENIQPALTLPSFDQFQGTVYEQNVDMVSFDSIEVGNLRDGTRPPNTTEAIGNPGPRLQPESQIASTNQQIIPDMTKQANTTEASGKEKHSQGNEKMFRIVLLHNTLIYEELEKVNSLPAHLCGDLAPLLDHHQIAQLSTDEPQVLLLRLLYFTIGSCQSLLGFKDTLRIAREMPDYSIFASRRNLSDMERFDQICRLDKTEALCVLLKRCHIAILFEKEREYLLQNDSIVIETPLTIREGHRAEMGNPVAKHEAALTDMMLYKFKPELKKGTDEFKKYRGQVSRLRQLAKRLRILTSKFGFGILALLPSEPACPEFKLTDSM